jgi:protein-disulfide isomerase
MTSTEPEPSRAGEQYPPADGQQPFRAAPKTNTLAIISLVSAFFVSLAAVITGHLALGQIKRTGEGGRGLAITGLVLGYVGIVGTTLAVVMVIVFAATVVPLIVSVVNGAMADQPSISATSEPQTDELPGTLPTGTVGAAHFDDGYLAVGTGPALVDVYVDPMCPYCRQFEETNGGRLADLVADGTITLRLHSLTFLDRVSQGTAYSTRASAALTCQATLNPENLLGYQAALFANQPAENTEGLNDSELRDLFDSPVDIGDCLAAGEYQAWSRANTEQALNGPIADAEITRIQGTPTVLVNGSVYSGGLTDPAEFLDFLRTASAG